MIGSLIFLMMRTVLGRFSQTRRVFLISKENFRKEERKEKKGKRKQTHLSTEKWLINSEFLTVSFTNLFSVILVSVILDFSLFMKVGN